MESNRINIGIDQLKYLFNINKSKLIPPEEAQKTKLTETLYNTIKSKVKAGELVVIGVRGEVRTGKSTVVLVLAQFGNKIFKELGINEKPYDNQWRYIFADQTEFLRFINTEEKNAFIAIDEFNTMAQTGLNATTEGALFDHYSDVFAGQYLHRITASPDIITDRNTTIILDVMGKDTKTGYIRVQVSYRDIISKGILVLGHADIYVGDMIKNWLESGIKELVEGKGEDNCTQEEKEKIEYWRKKDFYIRYQIKKYRRMDLTKKHGVRDIRDLEYSTIVLSVLEELEEIARGKKVTKEIIDMITDEMCKKHKRIYTLLVQNEIASRARGILSLYREIHIDQQKLKKTKDLAYRDILQKSIDKAQKIVDKRVAMQEHYAYVYKEYLGIQ